MKPHVNVNHIINLDGDVKSKIKTRLLMFCGIFLLLSILIIIVCILFSLINTKQFQKEEETKMISRQVAQATLKIRDEIKTTEILIDLAHVAVNNQSDSWKLMDSFLNLHTDISGITLIINKDRVIPYKNMASPYYFKPSTPEVFNELQIYRGDLGLILRRKEYDGEYLQFIKSIEEQDSNRKKLIVIEKNLGLIKKHIQEVDLPAEGNLIFVNSIGDVLFSTNEQEPPFTDKNILNHLNNTSGMTDQLMINGVNKYVFYDRSALDGCIVLYLMPAQYFERNDFSAFYLMGISVFLGFLLVLINISLFYQNIYRPIVGIERLVMQIDAGHYDYDIVSMNKGKFLQPIFNRLKNIMDNMKKLSQSEYSSKVLIKQAELFALQCQINPHFLHNTLETIRGQAISKGARDIEQMTKALSQLFRYSIINKGSMVNLEEEIQNVENYLTIQHYRFSNKFSFINKVDKDTLKHRVPKLLIQPLVENAFQHGLETKVGAGEISIHAFRTQNRLIIQIKDDGVGIEKEKLDEINAYIAGMKNNLTQKENYSIGLINVIERIKLNFGPEYGIKIYSIKGSGTMVEVILPLI